MPIKLKGERFERKKKNISSKYFCSYFQRMFRKNIGHYKSRRKVALKK